MKYVSIDIESTGLNAETCDLLEVGAVIDDIEAPEVPLDELPAFHCYVVRLIYKGEPYALSMHPEIFRRIAKREKPYNYLEPDEVLVHFSDFLLVNFPNLGREKITVAGKNYQNLDKAFLTKLPEPEHLNILHHRVIDPAMWFWNPFEDKELPSSKVCLGRAGLDDKVAHTALEDARMVVNLIRTHLKRVGRESFLNSHISLF